MNNYLRNAKRSQHAFAQNTEDLSNDRLRNTKRSHSCLTHIIISLVIYLPKSHSLVTYLLMIITNQIPTGDHLTTV